MKRTISILLALVLALSLAACGKKNDQKDDVSSAPADSLTLLETVWNSYTDEEKFPAGGGDFDNSVDGAPGKFDISGADNLSYQLSVPADDAALLDDAASLVHMMNMNTFTCGALRVANAEDVSKLAEDIRNTVQGKQWMCGFPDKLVVITLESYVVSVYGNEELVNTFRDKLLSAYADASVTYDEAIQDGGGDWSGELPIDGPIAFGPVA